MESVVVSVAAFLETGEEGPCIGVVTVLFFFYIFYRKRISKIKTIYIYIYKLEWLFRRQLIKY